MNRNTILNEVRAEITRVNKAAGETVFNPAVTGLLESIMEKCEPSEAAMRHAGTLAAEWLGLPASTEHPDRWDTPIGSKTATGLYRTLRRIVDEEAA